MNNKELLDLAQVNRELMRLAVAVESNNQRVSTLETNQQLLKEAADRAFHAANKLNNTVRHLQCLEPDTEPDCPEALNEPPAHRQSLQSVSDIDEYSAVTSAAVGAATRAAIDVVRKHRSQAPVQVEWLGWKIKAPLLAFIILITLGSIAWSIFHRILR